MPYTRNQVYGKRGSNRFTPTNYPFIQKEAISIVNRKRLDRK